ncbi:guanylate-binding protein 2-like isoform X1 [Excalfactoria chinensis]|uniref:guanylate-binding protein 2-like isoform X1 n=1 Tax=Excalfactoria chinensis TaxID=46218 RepID=UPI003B3B8C8A
MDAPVPPMPAPLCLVTNEDGVLSLDPAALAVLQEVTQPLVVVAIAGPYRTGKSFLMNQLAQKRVGFPLGPTVRAETKGIWMWCLPHPRRPGVTLVLLDTEGLEDPNKGDSHNDAWIFTLALLLSSTLVYNSKGTIDQKALEHLELVTQLSELIRVRDGDKDGDDSVGREDDAEDCEFVRFFPGFVWVVRDFTLELRLGERPISEDEYLEQALELKHGHSRKVQNYNATRLCLRNYFPTRKCFVLPSPLGTGEQRLMEELPEDALAPRFLQQAAKFCDYVLSSAWPKTLPDGGALTGRALCMLLRSYLEAINSGRLPCLEGAAEVMMANENAAAVAAALEAYARGMRELQQPTEPAQLSTWHAEHLSEALDVFRRRSFRDRDQEHQRRLMEQISMEYSRLQEENDAASRRRCKALLAELVRALDTNLAHGTYAQPGGYRAYEAERQRLLEGYRQAEDKGPKAEEVLDEFLAERRAEAEAVLKADNALSEVEKQLEGEWPIPVLSLLSSPPHPSLCPPATRGISQRFHGPWGHLVASPCTLGMLVSLQGHLTMAPSLEESHSVRGHLTEPPHLLGCCIVPGGHHKSSLFPPLSTSPPRVPSPHPHGPFFNQKREAGLSPSRRPFVPRPEAAGAAPGAAAKGGGGARAAAAGAAGGRARQPRAEPAGAGGQDAGGGGGRAAGAEPGAGRDAAGAQRDAAARLQRAGGADGAGAGGAAEGDQLQRQQAGAGGQRRRGLAGGLRPRQRVEAVQDEQGPGHGGVRPRHDADPRRPNKALPSQLRWLLPLLSCGASGAVTSLSVRPEPTSRGLKPFALVTIRPC